MAINLRSTRDVVNSGIKILVYGMAGVGKTTLIQTLESPIIISAEGGLLSLQNCNIPYVEVKNLAGLAESYEWLAKSEEAKQYKSVALDSVSEIGEVLLSEAKQSSTNKDGRAVYGETNDRMSQVIRRFRDLPGRHVYFSAKAEKTQTEEGALLYSPSMPGKTLTQSLPYFFDEVLALKIARNEKGEIYRQLQCQSDLTWLAKDRSGKLAAVEPPDLSAIIAKISGVKNAER